LAGDAGFPKTSTSKLTSNVYFFSKNVFNHDSEGIASLGFSPDGKRLLTSSYGGALKLVNAESGDVISDMDTGDDLAVHAVITPDGSGAISVGREVLKWDLSSAKKSHGFGLGKTLGQSPGDARGTT